MTTEADHHRTKVPKTPQNLIYGLIDPRDHLIYYVGLSSRGMRRPREHRKNPDFDCGKWIKQLQAAGLDYEIVVLEVLPDDSKLSVTERWWIAYGKCCGWPLTNLTRGGEYDRHFRMPGIGVSPEDIQQASIVNFCKLYYKNHGVEPALEIAKRGLSKELFEWFKAVVIDHCLAMSSELPPHLICPCGQVELFFDGDSLGEAVKRMIAHIAEMQHCRNTEASQKRRWMLHLS